MRRGSEQWVNWEVSIEPHLNKELWFFSFFSPYFFLSLFVSDYSQFSQMNLSSCKLLIIYGWVMMELKEAFFFFFFFKFFFLVLMAAFGDMNMVLKKIRVGVFVCEWMRAKQTWLSHIMFLSCPSALPQGCHHFLPLLHLGICLFQASGVSNWLFSCAWHNWALITVLHSVLIFKSAMSSERRASRSHTPTAAAPMRHIWLVLSREGLILSHLETHTVFNTKVAETKRH